MKLSRRQLLGTGIAAGTAACLSGCQQSYSLLSQTDVKLAGPKTVPEPISRWINRTGFGARPGDFDKIATLGIEKATDLQLAANNPEPLPLQLAIRRLDAFSEPEIDLEGEPYYRVSKQVQQATLLRAIHSENQLKERLVDFWSNHFNIYDRKAKLAYRKPADDIHVIQDHALGTFPDLLKASAHSPAMLEYLDNSTSQKGTPNENYARELMELHTLGVHGGYTQKDVMEVARCFTGWTIEDRFLQHKGTFRFNPDLHDKEAKFVLGKQIPADGGVDDGEMVLDLLAHHPSTARFISTKLCAYFLGAPDPKWVDRLTDIYLKTDGNIKQMLRPILISKDLVDAPPIAKRPLDFLASSVRAVGGGTDGKAIHDHLEKMGQPLNEWPMPDGYPVVAEAWTGTMLARWNFITDLLTNKIGGTEVPLNDLKPLLGNSPEKSAEFVFGKSLAKDSALLKTLDTHRGTEVEQLAICLASPEFQWR